MDWWATWVTYGFEKPFALSHVATWFGFESKVSGIWLPEGRSTRNFLGGWFLLAVIFFNNSLLTSSITAAQKQDVSRRQNNSNNLKELPHNFLCSLTSAFGLPFVEAVSVAQRARRWRLVALLHTNTVHEKATAASIISKTGLSFISLWLIHFCPGAKSKICVWKYFTPGREAACSTCCRACSVCLWECRLSVRVRTYCCTTCRVTTRESLYVELHWSRTSVQTIRTQTFFQKEKSFYTVIYLWCSMHSRLKMMTCTYYTLFVIYLGSLFIFLLIHLWKISLTQKV